MLSLILCAAPLAHAGEELLRRAEAHYQRLYQTGHIATTILFKLNSDPSSAEQAASAIPDFEDWTCTVSLSPAALEKLGFSEGSRFRFMILHEMAHCDLYFSRMSLEVFTELHPIANLLLSDLVEIEYLYPSASRHTNGYITYHETYADIKALALLIREGASQDDINAILRFRDTGLGSVLGSHDSGNILAAVPAYDWQLMTPSEMEASVRTLADQHIVTNFIEKVFAPAYTHFAVSRLLEGGLRTICSGVSFQGALPREASFLKRRLREVSNSPKMLWQDIAALIERGLPCSELVEQFFRNRYGKVIHELAEFDKAISTRLKYRVH